MKPKLTGTAAGYTQFIRPINHSKVVTQRAVVSHPRFFQGSENVVHVLRQIQVPQLNGTPISEKWWWLGFDRAKVIRSAGPIRNQWRTSADAYAVYAKEQDESANSGMDQSSPRENPNLSPKIVSILSSHSCISLPKPLERL